MGTRMLDPVKVIQRDADAALGVVPAGEMARRIETTRRQDIDPARKQLVIVQETLWFTRSDPAANATTTLLTPFPTSSSAFGANSRSHYVPKAGRLLVARLSTNADLTAGTMTPEIQITEGSDVSTVLLEEAALDTTYVNSKAVAFDWEVAPQIAAEALIAARVVTSSGYLPVTLDVTLSLVIGYGEWI